MEAESLGLGRARPVSRGPRRGDSWRRVENYPARQVADLALRWLGTLPALPNSMAKQKLKWFREGCDPHEDLYLIPVDQARTEDDSLNTDAAVAWIKIAYDRTRFYSGRGGEGTSRPDSYVAFVQDTRAGRQHRGIVIAEGANAVAHIGGLFSDRSDRSFISLRAAKLAISTELAKRSAPPTPTAQPTVVEQGESS